MSTPKYKDALPDDGKRKKAVVQQSFDTPIRSAAALNNQGRRFLLPGAGSAARGMEETAMLIRPAFQRNSFLKKACTQQGAAPANSMNYTM